jgi:nucleotide-binding universal stress UspA family protein
MSGIVCAIRGGPNSRSTIDHAISLAEETGLPLYFLYVVNLDFLSHTTSSRVQAISTEMHQMGEFILLSARSTAAAKKLTTQGVVRHGNVADEIINQCHEIEADYLVLGLPQGQDPENIFSRGQLQRFSERIEREAGAKVILTGGTTDE